MDTARWKRDAAYVQARLEETPDKQLIARAPTAIYIPKRFSEKGLAEIGGITYIVGIFAMVVDDQFYSVSTANAMMRLTPDVISTVKFGDVPYLEFKFEPGSVICPTLDLIVKDTLVYQIFDEIVAKGNCPWYIGYEDLGRLFETADNHAGLNLRNNRKVLEMIAASITRSTGDRKIQYRHTVKSRADIDANPPVMIPQRSIVLGASNTSSRLIGSYWEDGVSSALVTPSTKLEPIEDILLR